MKSWPLGQEGKSEAWTKPNWGLAEPLNNLRNKIVKVLNFLLSNQVHTRLGLA